MTRKPVLRVKVDARVLISVRSARRAGYFVCGKGASACVGIIIEEASIRIFARSKQITGAHGATLSDLDGGVSYSGRHRPRNASGNNRGSSKRGAPPSQLPMGKLVNRLPLAESGGQQ